MNQLRSLLFLCLAGQLAIAQVNIRGKVADKSGPVAFANVLIYPSGDTTHLVAFTATDTTGAFVFNTIPSGSYNVQFRMLGYQTNFRSLDVSQGQQVYDFGVVPLEEDATMLGTVVVTGQRPPIEKTEQGFIINTSTNIVQMGGTATDLLRNTPLISVDADGGITLRGKPPLIFINGRNSALANTDQIAASNIERIEIITSPTAKYDANAESGIINIVLKKNRDSGVNGALATAAGMGAKGRVSNSLIVNSKTEKWNLGLSYNNRFAGRTRIIDGGRTNFNLADEYQLDQNRSDKRLEQLQNAKVNVDFSPDKQDNLSFELIGNTEGEDNNESLQSIWNNNAGAQQSNGSRFSRELRRSNILESALTFGRSFDDPRKSIAANLTTSINRDRENTDINSQTLSESNLPEGDPFLQRTHNYEDGAVSNARIDIQLPVGEKGQFETGYKGIYRYLNSDYLTANDSSGTYIPNEKASSLYEFREQVHAAYAQYNAFAGDKDNPKLRYLAGLRLEDVSNHGNVINQKATFSVDYLKIFPTVEITYYNSPENYWKASYSKRINRPGFGQLNPFIDITDSLNQHSGNPNLKPEIIHALEIGNSYAWENVSLSVNLFYRYSLNSIRPYTELKPNGVAISYPVNIGTAALYGTEGVFTAKVNAVYQLNASLSFFQQQLNGGNISTGAVNNAFGWYGKLINNFSPVSSMKVQVLVNYNSALATPQGRRIAQYFVDLGVQQKLGKGNTRLGLVVTDMFNMLKSGIINNTPDFYNYRNAKSDTRAFMLTFAYTFRSAFRESLLENKFSREY